MALTATGRSALAYYATPGAFTDLAPHAERVRDLPESVADLCRVVQGLIVHPFFAGLYGLSPQQLRQDDLAVRPATALVDRLLQRDPRPLTEPRTPEHRFVGNCRHFTVLLCAFLRAQGVAARARCGFAAYFKPSWFEDHWVAEIWDELGQTWRLVDAQLDPVQCATVRVPFDPLDVPRTQYLVGGEAWRRCRAGAADPERFGIFDLRGQWFVLQHLLRDFAAGAKHELLTWDGWGLMTDRDRHTEPAVLALLDRVAELTAGGLAGHAEMLELYHAEASLRVPRVIISFGPGGGAKVDLAPLIAA